MQLRDAASEWFLSHDKGELGESDSKLQDTINALASGDVQGRRDACYDSATLGGPEIVAALINTLEQHPDIEYNSISDIYQCSRKGAAYALGKLSDPSSVPALLTALGGDNQVAARGADLPFFFGASVKEGLEEAEHRVLSRGAQAI